MPGNGATVITHLDRDKLARLSQVAANRGKLSLAKKINAVLSSDLKFAQKKGNGSREVGEGVANLPKSVRRALGDDVADTFDQMGETTYQALLKNVSDAILKTLASQESTLQETLQKDFGEKGAKKALDSVGDWRSNLVGELTKSLPDYVAEVLDKADRSSSDEEGDSEDSSEDARDSKDETPSKEKEKLDGDANKTRESMTRLQSATNVVKKAAAVLKSLGEEDLARSLITGDLSDLGLHDDEDEGYEDEEDTDLGPADYGLVENEDLADVDLEEGPLEDAEEDEDECPDEYGAVSGYSCARAASTLRKVAKVVKTRGEKKLAKEILAVADDVEDEEDDDENITPEEEAFDLDIDDSDLADDLDLDEEHTAGEDEDEPEEKSKGADDEDEDEDDEDEDDEKSTKKNGKDKQAQTDLKVVVGSLIKRGEYNLASEILAAIGEEEDESGGDEDDDLGDEDDLSDDALDLSSGEDEDDDDLNFEEE